MIKKRYSTEGEPVSVEVGGVDRLAIIIDDTEFIHPSIMVLLDPAQATE